MGGSALSGVAQVLRPKVAVGACAVQHGLVPARLPKTVNGGRRASGARAAEAIMAIKTRDTEFCHPEAVAFLGAYILNYTMN